MTQKKKNEKTFTVASKIFPGGILLEQLFSPEENTCKFGKWTVKGLETVEQYRSEDGRIYVPYAPDDNLIKNNVVLFPSTANEYGSDSDLVSEIQSFIHRYVDVSPVFESIATYYVLLTWLYDRFRELPYLRLRGDFGTGKTRFLLTVGSLCYRPIFASGASTVAPLFHILDDMGGTLLIDEADFRFTDERADIVKILNNGNARGFPVLRCEKISNGQFRARCYQVFGPKIVASRSDFEDQALESRFLTEDMGLRGIRQDVPVTLPESFAKEAQSIRNKLLMFRFRNFDRYRAAEVLADRTLEMRANQTLLSLLSVIRDAEVRQKVLDHARDHAEQYRVDRSMQVEAHVLSAIKRLRKRMPGVSLSIADIAREVGATHSKEYDRRVTPKWVGYVVRKKLHLATRKSNGIYVISDDPTRNWEHLFRRFGV